MPSEVPTTVLLSVHKGASTFLTNNLVPEIIRLRPGMRHLPYGALLWSGEAPETLALPSTGVVATRVYPDHYDTIAEDPVPAGGRFAGKRLLMLRRDPRDAAVSAYYSYAYSHGIPPRESQEFHGFLERRERLQQVDVRVGVRDHTAQRMCGEFLGTVDFLVRHPETHLTTYEQLVTDFPGWIATVGEVFGWTSDETRQAEERLAPVVAPPESVDHMKHKRRVTPGNWREVFDDELRELFSRLLGPHLEAAGYTW